MALPCGDQYPLPWIPRREQGHSRAGLGHFLGSFCDRLVGFEKPQEGVVVNELTVMLLQLEVLLRFWILEIPPPPADWLCCPKTRLSMIHLSFVTL